MGQPKGGDASNGWIGVEDRDRVRGVRAGAEHHLGVHLEIGQGATGDGGPRGRPEQQDAGDEGRGDRDADQRCERPARFADDETHGVPEQRHAETPAVRRPSRIR